MLVFAGFNCLYKANFFCGDGGAPPAQARQLSCDASAASAEFSRYSDTTRLLTKGATACVLRIRRMCENFEDMPQNAMRAVVIYFVVYIVVCRNMKCTGSLLTFLIWTRDCLSRVSYDIQQYANTPPACSPLFYAPRPPAVRNAPSSVVPLRYRPLTKPDTVSTSVGVVAVVCRQKP